ncbi:hypothetical protein, unknown function [Leishmania tarentolae]|uniref:Uncharacterized protein n=1 Tax=Leishmania tarentolae TaxID=5689 RepID=A0A640KY19_LEITA|nr:hypothetical protein, unknown function [Leishmania tarentolae]GET93993.1 hypothetical protein, unknown function [Leishmania tarentolae]GET94049.1 hypothetical protein, unknown function [Leishmania tarentolae]
MKLAPAARQRAPDTAVLTEDKYHIKLHHRVIHLVRHLGQRARDPRASNHHRHISIQACQATPAAEVVPAPPQ